jgi:hypothetical protein
MKKILFIIALLFAGQSHAHGGEEHKDHAHAAPSTVLETAAAAPTLRAESEQFELVARLYADELGIYIDRWASNAPLLHAEVEVELNGKKTVAKFHEDHGDYAVSDPGMLEALQAAGDHSLLFTIVAGKESDLLAGELHVVEAGTMETLSKKTGSRLLIGALAALILIGCGLGMYHLLRARKERRV